jgi:hypothetical protein
MARKIRGLFSSSGDQQGQPFVQVNGHRNIWIKCNEWQQLARLAQNADELLIPDQTDCLAFLSTGWCRGQVKRTAASLQALQPMPAGRGRHVVALIPLRAFFARHQPHPALQDLERRRPRSGVLGQLHASQAPAASA